MRLGGGALVLAALVLVGCDALAGIIPAPPRGPAPCGQLFSPDRCRVMTDQAASELRLTREDVASIEIIPEPTPEVRDGVTILQIRSGAPPIDLLVTLADGTTRQTSICGGMQSPACSDDPHIEIHSMSLDGGYHDVTEGSSPVPSAAPAAVADATELRIDRLDIPIDRTGHHEIVLGDLLVANGLLKSADFALVDDWPPGVTILYGVYLEIRAKSDGKVIWNIYEHGWREGVEGVDAVLVFDVFHVDPGATLSIRDVVVR